MVLAKTMVGAPGVLDCCFEGGVHLDGIVSAQPHARQLLVGEVLHHLQQAGIGAEKVLAEVRSAFDEVFLVLAIADFAHAANQQTVAVILNEACPSRCPR